MVSYFSPGFLQCTVIWTTQQFSGANPKGPERSGMDSYFSSQEGSYVTSLGQATLVADTGKNCIQDTLNHIQGIKWTSTNIY